MLMKITLITIAALIGLAETPALAADKLSVSLSANQEQVIVTALRLFDGHQVVVKGSLGQDQVVFAPYDLDNGVRLTIAHNISVLDRTLDEFRAVAKGGDQKKVGELADTKAQIELLSLDPALLRIANNPYPPSLLAAISPICPACLADEARKP